MYKLTSLHDTAPIYDSVFNTLSHHEEFLPDEHRFWKDDILIGKIHITAQYARIIFDNSEEINLPRNEFQRLFMTNAPLVQMIFGANEVESVRIDLKKRDTYIKNPRLKTARLYRYPEKSTPVFFADLFYWLKN